MTLLELSGEYRASAAALRERVLLLEHRLRGADGDGRRLLEGRIRLLRAMGREARELAVLCERYYERGYCRNGKYTLYAGRGLRRRHGGIRPRHGRR